MSVLKTFLVSNFSPVQTYFFLLSPVRWFCHFDDDNYVNVPTLVKTLQSFNSHEDVYLGKPSLLKAMEVIFRTLIFTAKCYQLKDFVINNSSWTITLWHVKFASCDFYERFLILSTLKKDKMSDPLGSLGTCVPFCKRIC